MGIGDTIRGISRVNLATRMGDMQVVSSVLDIPEGVRFRVQQCSGCHSLGFSKPHTLQASFEPAKHLSLQVLCCKSPKDQMTKPLRPSTSRGAEVRFHGLGLLAVGGFTLCLALAIVGLFLPGAIFDLGLELLFGLGEVCDWICLVGSI